MVATVIQRAERLYGVKPELVSIVLGAGVETSFVVTCGIRTVEEQRAAVDRGASQTMKSKHLTGHAVDLAVLVDGKVTWEWDYYMRLSIVMKAVAKRHGVSIVWGGDWSSLKDGPHFELVQHVGVSV